jgi:hypothetical protein
MPSSASNACRPSVARKAFAGLLLHVVLLLAVCSSGPLLHRLWHADALAPNHACAITTLAAGHALPASATLVALSPTLGWLAPALRPSPPATLERDRRLASPRAPPVRFVCSMG